VKSRPGSVIYLVPGPEAVRDIDRALLLKGGCRGISGRVVMSFVKLALRVLKEAGCFPVRQIHLVERKYLILRIIRETPLRFFESVRDYEGFAEVVAEFIAELKRAMIAPEDFLQGAAAATGRGGIAGDKVHELHAIYLAYHNILTRRGAYDDDGLQWKAAEVLTANRSLLSDVETMLVDGFATYTPVEFEMLTRLVERTRESHITLCYEERRPDVFAFVEGTYRGLKKMCTEGEIVLTGNRRASGALLHLERALFGEGESEMLAERAVSIIACPDAYREVETVAREIERMRREEGLEYSDFLVIFRDVGEYSRAITEVFGERRLPFFLPKKASVAEEPFVKALISALHLMNGKFRREDALPVLKNSYLDADMDAAAAVENYADEFGLWDEEHFRETWSETSEVTQDVSPLNELKTRFLEMLDRLRSEASEVSSAEGFRQFILHTIRELGFLTLGQQSEGKGKYPSSGESNPIPSFSSEYRSLTAVARLLDTMCEYARLVGLRGADYGVFLEMLERGLSWMPVLSPSRDLNSVRVTPIVGGPPRQGAVVFVCGLCERSFPREVVNEPFFKDRERRLINRRGKIVLDERLPLSSGERFFFYVAVTRATRRLLLTYPARDTAGKELVRSHYIEEVARIFSDLKHEAEEEPPVVGVVPELTALANAGELRSFVAYHLSRAAPTSDFRFRISDSAIRNLQMAALTYNELLRLGILGADDLVYQAAAARLSEEAYRTRKERDVYLTSVSELESFAQCPFRHFCQYRLRLKELPRYEFGPREEGILYHEVLARLYREIYLPARESPPPRDDAPHLPSGAIEALSPQELDEKLTLLVNDLINQRYSRLFRAPRMEVRRRALDAKIKDFILKEVENERANATRPTYFELSFGRGKSKQNADGHSTETPLSIKAQEGPSVRISGRMDRVDIFEEGGERYGAVLDYKRRKVVSRTELRNGTVLQAGLYMLALKELFGVEPAAAFYYSISSGRKRGVFAAEEKERVAGQRDVSKTDGTSYEEIRELMELNARQAVEYVRRIVEGEIAIRPADKKECHSCPFSSVCRIKEQARLL